MEFAFFGALTLLAHFFILKGEMKMKCKNCGSTIEINEQEKYCPICGDTLNLTTKEIELIKETKNKKVKKTKIIKYSKLISIFVIILCERRTLSIVPEYIQLRHHRVSGLGSICI